MTRHREPDELLDAYLAEGMQVLPDRVVEAVLDEVHRTRQRAAFGPWRIERLNSAFKLALAAAAVVAVALAGITLLPRDGGGFGGTGASTPTPVPTPTATPISLPVDPQELTVSDTGSYLAGDPFQVPITMTVPAGWVGKVGGPYAAYLDLAPVGSGNAAITLSLSQAIFADPCHQDRGFLAPQPGPTVDDLAAALASLPGFEATTPTEVTVDGHSGKQLTLTAPASFSGCSLSPDFGYRLWQLPLGGIQSFDPGQQTMLWILDVNGKRLVISSDTYPTTTAQEMAEVQAIMDSIRIVKNN